MRTWGIPALIGFALVVFVAPFLFRASVGAPITPGAESYTELRYAELALNGNIGYDPLHDAYSIPTPYTLLLALMIIFGVPWLLPVLLSLLFIGLLAVYLQRIIRSYEIVLLSITILIISPTMSVLSTGHNHVLFALVALIGTALLFDEYPVFGSLLLALACIENPVLGAVAVLYLIFFFIKRRRIGALLSVLGCAVASVLWFEMWSRTIPFTLPITFSTVFFELGNPGGISLFILLLALYGVRSSLLDIEKPLVFAAATFLFLTIVLPSFAALALIPLVVLAAVGVFDLLRVDWELDLLRQFLIVLVCCLGVFLVLASAKARVGEQPTQEFTRAMIYLHDQYRPGTVLSLPEYAPMIEYFVNRKATLHAETTEINRVLRSRDANEVYTVLDKEQAAYVLITDEMLGAFFQRSDEGILFLLPNTQRFILIQQIGGTKVWYYIPNTHLTS